MQFLATKPKEATTEAFHAFALHNSDKTIQFVAELVLVYASAILAFVDAVRSNDTVGMRAARAAFLPVWFGRNHPVYQLLLITDELMRLRLPHPVKQQLEATEAVSRCLDDKHEGTVDTKCTISSLRCECRDWRCH